MRTPASLQDFSSIDAQAEQLTGFDQRYQQLESGRYAGAFLAAEGPELGLFVEITNRRLFQQGAGPPDHVSLVAFLGRGEPGVVNGMTFGKDDLLLVGPGGSYDAVVAPGTIPVVLSMRCAEVEALRERGRVRRVRAPGCQARWHCVITDVLMSWRPDLASVDLPGPALRELLLEAVGRGEGLQPRRPPAWTVFRRARHQLLQDLGRPMTVESLATSIGASRRTLEYACERYVGMGPGRFRKRLRLNQARRALQTGKPTVAEAATSVGLSHLGRFSGEYRALFGEFPSETRRGGGAASVCAKRIESRLHRALRSSS